MDNLIISFKKFCSIKKRIWFGNFWIERRSFFQQIYRYNFAQNKVDNHWKIKLLVYSNSILEFFENKITFWMAKKLNCFNIKINCY